MDSQDPNMADDELEEYMEDAEEVEVTREELIGALQDVVTKLSAGLQGGDREIYLSSDYPPEDYPAQQAGRPVCFSPRARGARGGGGLAPRAR